MKELLKYLSVLCILLWNCTGADPISQNTDKDYFPLQVGSFQIYTVEQTEYTSIDQSSFSQYELKTEIVDSFQSMDGLTTYVIHRSKRGSEAASWEFIDTWSARLSNYEAIMNEGNTSFIRIAFPVLMNKQWNGNALNTMEEDLYFVDDIRTAFELDNGQTFNDCLVINQEDYLDELSKNERLEVYARNIGLIYRKYIVLNYCDEGNCFGQQKIENGMEYHQVLKEYGKN